MKPTSSTRTALLLIDIQNGLRHPTYYGVGRSTPNFEENVARILSAARTCNQRQANTVPIIHIHHRSTNPESPLYPGAELLVPDTTDGKDTPSAPKEIVKVRGCDPMPCAVPLPGEPVMIKSVNSAFIGTDLAATLRKERVKQLIVLGITTDHCVSSTVRMGANLGVLDFKERVEGDDDTRTGEEAAEGTIVLIEDGCAAYGKGGFDGETVHKVNLASLNEEFAEVVTTRRVLKEVFESEM